jgi:rRNA maturation RNase YbeY
MIDFHYEVGFILDGEKYYVDWLSRVILSEHAFCRHIDYIFCSDNFLLNLNIKFLGHDTLTDILTFDDSSGSGLRGDIFISVDRVKENAAAQGTDFTDELRRVMVHGILHMLGYRDKSKSEISKMRAIETEKMKMFHVEQ